MLPVAASEHHKSWPILVKKLLSAFYGVLTEVQGHMGIYEASVVLLTAWVHCEWKFHISASRNLTVSVLGMRAFSLVLLSLVLLEGPGCFLLAGSLDDLHYSQVSVLLLP